MTKATKALASAAASAANLFAMRDMPSPARSGGLVCGSGGRESRPDAPVEAWHGCGRSRGESFARGGGQAPGGRGRRWVIAWKATCSRSATAMSCVRAGSGRTPTTAPATARSAIASIRARSTASTSAAWWWRAWCTFRATCWPATGPAALRRRAAPRTPRRTAVIDVMTGKQGGPLADLAGLIGKEMPARRAPITFDLVEGKGTLEDRRDRRGGDGALPRPDGRGDDAATRASSPPSPARRPMSPGRSSSG